MIRNIIRNIIKNINPSQEYNKEYNKECNQGVIKSNPNGSFSKASRLQAYSLKCFNGVFLYCDIDEYSKEYNKEYNKESAGHQGR